MKINLADAFKASAFFLGGDMFRKGSAIFKVLGTLVVCTFVFSILLVDVLRVRTSQASVLGLPEPTQMISVSAGYSSPLIKGLKVDPADPMNIKFIITKEDDKSVSQEEASELVRYFMASLTVPTDSLWVNLSPYENDRIIDEKLSETDLGKGFLSQDYVLKQLSSSITHPDSEIGESYWAKLNEMTENTAQTFNKIWIVPDQVEVHEENGMVLISKASLKVMLENDYLAMQQSSDPTQQKIDINSKSADVMRSTVLPAISKDVNKGKNFAQLRQMYNAIILGMWFKKKFANSFYSHYINKGKITGIDLEDKKLKEKVYSLYVKAFEKGVYNYIKKEFNPEKNKKVMRHYFSGGLALGKEVSSTLEVKQGIQPSEFDVFAGPTIVSAYITSSGKELKAPVLLRYANLDGSFSKYDIQSRVNVAAAEGGITRSVMSSSVAEIAPELQIPGKDESNLSTEDKQNLKKSFGELEKIWDANDVGQVQEIMAVVSEFTPGGDASSAVGRYIGAVLDTLTSTTKVMAIVLMLAFASMAFKAQASDTRDGVTQVAQNYRVFKAVQQGAQQNPALLKVLGLTAEDLVDEDDNVERVNDKFKATAKKFGEKDPGNFLLVNNVVSSISRVTDGMDAKVAAKLVKKHLGIPNSAVKKYQKKPTKGSYQQIAKGLARKFSKGEGINEAINALYKENRGNGLLSNWNNFIEKMTPAKGRAFLDSYFGQGAYDATQSGDPIAAVDAFNSKVKAEKRTNPGSTDNEISGELYDAAQAEIMEGHIFDGFVEMANYQGDDAEQTKEIETMYRKLFTKVFKISYDKVKAGDKAATMKSMKATQKAFVDKNPSMKDMSTYDFYIMGLTYNDILGYQESYGDGFLKRIGIQDPRILTDMGKTMKAVSDYFGAQDDQQAVRKAVNHVGSASSNVTDGGIDLNKIEIVTDASSAMMGFAPFDVANFTGFSVTIVSMEQATQESLLALAK